MPDSAFGFALLGIALLVVLGVVFVAFSRGGPSSPAPRPPRGVHVPAPSVLPALLSAGVALIGAGLAFRGDTEIANPFLALPGIGVLIISIVWWVSAANSEWTDTERGSHGDGAGH